MPNERAARDDFLAAVEHIRKLISITDEIDELIPCGWLSKEEAAQLRAIHAFLFRCVLDGHPLVSTLRDAVDSLLAIFNEDRVAAVLWEDHRIAKAREVLKETVPASDSQMLETAIDHVKVLVDIIRGFDKGDECKQLVLRHDEDIVDAMAFVRMHIKPDTLGDQPYSVAGFTTVDELIDHLRNKQGQPDEGSDYGDENQEWIET
jgi:hypothetical protein